MTTPEKHVLVWVAPEFLQSRGVVRILEEAGAIGGRARDPDEVAAAAVRSGGFAISGILLDANHGAGIWIAPGQSRNLQLIIPWGFVRCSILAEEPKAARIYGLVSEFADRDQGSQGPG